ncbi:DUF262 domain-containing protein [Rhizobacter fulvus]
MTHTLTAKEQSLAKIFSDDYVFTIPGYQRPYAWGKDQAQELLDDLLGALASAPAQLSEAAPYFLGSIVLIKGETLPEATVVDGQQRLTTLTLLLSAIRATVQDASVQIGITKRIYEHGDVVSATQARYRLLMRERDRISSASTCNTKTDCWSWPSSTRRCPMRKPAFAQTPRCSWTGWLSCSRPTWCAWCSSSSRAATW